MSEGIRDERQVEGFGDPQYTCSDLELAIRHCIYIYLQGCKAAGSLSRLEQTQDWSGNTLHIEGSIRPRELAAEIFKVWSVQPYQQEKEKVNHPAHYGGDTTYEVIKVLQAWMTRDEYIGFCKGNSIKYEARHRQKGGDADLAKALWYQNELNRFLKG